MVNPEHCHSLFTSRRITLYSEYILFMVGLLKYSIRSLKSYPSNFSVFKLAVFQAVARKKKNPSFSLVSFTFYTYYLHSYIDLVEILFVYLSNIQQLVRTYHQKLILTQLLNKVVACTYVSSETNTHLVAQKSSTVYVCIIRS